MKQVTETSVAHLFSVHGNCKALTLDFLITCLRTPMRCSPPPPPPPPTALYQSRSSPPAPTRATHMKTIRHKVRAQRRQCRGLIFWQALPFVGTSSVVLFEMMLPLHAVSHHDACDQPRARSEQLALMPDAHV